MEEKNIINALIDFLKKNVLKILIYSIILFGLSHIIIDNVKLDEISDIYENNYPEAMIITVGSVAVVGIVLFKMYRNIGIYYKSSKLNNIDLGFIIIDIVLFLLWWKYKHIICPCMFCAYILLQIGRILNFSLSKKENNYNEVWLSDVYSNKINRRQYKSVIIRGDESIVDLLDKGNEIDSISNTILNCNPKNTFCIGIDGEWGKGKTTLVNFVLEKISKKSSEYVIVKFDPCKYKDCETMLAGFYNEIAKKIGIYNRLKYKSALKLLIDEIFKEVYGKLKIPNLKVFINESSDINSIVCNELEIRNRKMIVVIDNLDRADREIINFFIRCMYSVTEFRRTVFLILYDADLINRHLSGLYGREKLFMNKIINLPISIADTDKNKINSIWYTSAMNLMNKGFIKKDKFERVNFYGDLREVARSLNCLIHKSDTLNKLKLNYYDYLGLMYIKEHEYELYKNIYENREILTYKNQYTFYDSKRKEEEDQIVNQIKDFCGSINNENCRNIIRNMFPNVSNVDIIGILPGVDIKNDDKNNICNIRYLPMYFRIEESEYSLAKKRVNSMIDRIKNSNEIIVYISELIEKILNEQNQTIKSYCMELLKNDIEASDRSKYNLTLFFDAIRDIVNNIEKYNVSLIGIKDILSAILSKMNDEEFSYEINNMSKEYNNLWLYDDLKAYPLNAERSDEIENMEKEMCDEILANRGSINLMEGKDYYYNLHVLYDKLGQEKLNKLMYDWLNEKTIFKYIKHGLLIYHKDGVHKYSYKPYNSNEKEKVDGIIKNINESELSPNERNVLYIYEKAYNNDIPIETLDKKIIQL